MLIISNYSELCLLIVIHAACLILASTLLVTELHSKFCYKLVKQDFRLLGVILAQNCVRLLDATLNDLFFQKFILSKAV